MYPSDRLEVFLKKDGDGDHHVTDFSQDESTNTETKIVTYTFLPKAEDIGKKITCVARLLIADMDFEPKERTSSQKINANCKYLCTRALASLLSKLLAKHLTESGKIVPLCYRDTHNSFFS